MKFVDISGQLFNSKYKLAFIETFEVGDKKRDQALGFFRQTKKVEERLNKDLYDMTFSELDELLRGRAYKNGNIVSREVGVLNAYVGWAIVEGYSSNQSHRHFALSREELNKYVYKKLNTVYTFDDLKEVFDKDKEIHALISWLMFEGIGSKEFDEIQTLTKDSLFKNEAEKCFVKTDRGYINIPNELHDRLLRFNEILNDSEMHNAFLESPYIFKPFKTKKNEELNEVFVAITIRNRIYINLKEALQDSTVTTKTLTRSGCNYYAYKFMQESGEMKLTADILKKIADRYDIWKNPKGGYYLGKILDELHLDFIEEEYGDFEIDLALKGKI